LKTHHQRADVPEAPGAAAHMRRGMPEHTDVHTAAAVSHGSSALREFCHAIEAALTLAAPATTKDELTYLRISRDRARVVLLGCKRVLADHELDDHDLMTIAASLRDMTTQLPADQYTPNSLNW
jgi:hypothetical protein